MFWSDVIWGSAVPTEWPGGTLFCAKRALDCGALKPIIWGIKASRADPNSTEFCLAFRSHAPKSEPQMTKALWNISFAFTWLITLSRTAWNAEHISVVSSKESKSPLYKSKTVGLCSFKKLHSVSSHCTLLIDINPHNEIHFHYPTLSLNSDKILALRSLSRSLKKSTPAVTFRPCAALVFRGRPFL